MSHVAQRLNNAKLSQQAPAVCSAEDQAILHKWLRSMYLAEVSQLQAKHEADLADLRQALEAARAEAAQEQLDLDNMYRPISEFGTVRL